MLVIFQHVLRKFCVLNLRENNCVLLFEASNQLFVTLQVACDLNFSNS